MEICRDFYIEDNIIKKTSEFKDEFLKEANNIYEVVRVKNGEILFFNDHFNRLEKSFDLKNIKFSLKKEEILKNIQLLMEKNKKFEGTIKIIFNINIREVKTCYYFYYTKDFNLKLYENGVDTRILFATRDNPNAKVIDSILREKADKVIEEKKIFEVLLVDGKKNIREGSRSNVFFIKEEKIYTPKGEKVLKGITRKRVFEICSMEGIEIIEKDISLKEIEESSEGFLSSTTFGVIPIKSVENKNFSLKENSISRKIAKIYMNKFK